MKKIYLICIFLCIAKTSLAQNNLAWAEQFGGTGVTSGSVLQLDESGNSYMAGSYPTSGITFGSITLPGTGGENSFITKFNPQGTPVWATRCRKIGGFDDQDNPEKLAVDNSGNIYIVGIYNTGATIGTMPIPGSYGYFIAKLNNAGVAQWVLPIVSPDNINAATISIFINSQQQLNILGLYNTSITFDEEISLLNTTNNALGDAFLAKYDTNGTILSAVELGTLNPAAFNPSAGFVPEFFRMDPNGNIYRLVKNGNTIEKYDNNGMPILTKTLDVTGTLYLNDFATDYLGNIFLNGTYSGDINIEGESYSGQPDDVEIDISSIFIKLNADGDFQWGHSVVSYPSTLYYKIKIDPIGNIYFSGVEAVQTGTISLIIAKYNSAGVLMWNQFMYPKNIPLMILGEASPRNIALAQNGGNIVFMGYYKRYLRFTDDVIFESPATAGRIFLAQYGLCNNTIIPVISSESTSFCEGESIVLTSSPAEAYLWSTGETTAQITVNTSGDYHLFSIEDGECFTQSAALHIEQFPLPDVSISNNGSLLTATGIGSYQWMNCLNDELLVNEIGETFTPLASGSYAVIVTNENGCSTTSECISVEVLGVDSFDSKNSIVLYPNPATNAVVLSSITKINSVEVINIFGQEVLDSNESTLNISKLANGIYIIIAETQYGKWFSKFVKE